ncbi:MAG: hypothetical protein IH595_11480 [Bacteroidales bacterium]|nr:hypothetical protein [Bacteroidales bacterium]
MINGRKTIFSYLYGWALILFVLSLPLSQYTLSLASFLILVLWVWSDIQLVVIARFFRQKGFFIGFYFLILYLFRSGRLGIAERTRVFWKNKAAVIFSAIFIIFLLGLIRTTGFSSGLTDLKIKLPLLLFPVAFSSLEKIDYQILRKVFLFYLLGLFASTLVGSYILIKGQFTDIRNISPFISSIRLGLNVSFGFFILIYFITKESYFNIKQKVLFAVLAMWFLAFLYFMEAITSLVAILIVGLAYLIYLTFNSRKSYYLKFAFLLLVIGIPVSIYFYVKTEVKEMTTAPTINAQNLDKYTALGNPYVFDKSRGVEDGKYVGLYLCETELRQSWDKRSKISYDGIDEKGNHLSQTLIRYLTSKNLRKDASGVASLSNEDIQHIEDGIANYNYIAHPGIRSRLLQIVKGYQVYSQDGDPNGSSVFQRIEYIKAAINIVGKHFWTGVGTGNLKKSISNELNEMHSKLQKKYIFFMAHNQFLSVFMAVGIFGFIFFIFALIYPIIITKSYQNYFFVVFYLIMIISMLSDDTLETHVGVSLFSFFSSLLLFGIQQKSLSSTKS